MDDKLIHYGIRGQRWGIRRFQNPDGTRTSAGKRRERASAKDLSDEELTKSVKRMSQEKLYNKLTKERARPSKIEQTKKVLDSSTLAIDRAKQLSRETRPQPKRMDLTKMTDQQLRDRINREQLERQYNQMFAKPATVSRGREYAEKVLSVTGSVLAIGSSALAIALSIKELRG